MECWSIWPNTPALQDSATPGEENGRKREPNHNHARMYRLPSQDIYDLQEPAEASGPNGVQEILPGAELSQAHAASRSEVTFGCSGIRVFRYWVGQYLNT